MEEILKKRVAFILPTRNRPDFVDQTLKAAQKYVRSSDELIVVDGSKDNKTAAVVKKYKKIVTKYLRTSDIGEGHKMNIGILNSTAEIIKPISDDDVVYPKPLDSAIKALQKDPDLDVLQCGGECYRYRPQDKTQEFLFYEKVPRRVTIGSNFNAVLQYVPCHLGLIYKRRILPIVGLYDTTFVTTDVNYMARFIKSNVVFKYLDICLYRHIQYAHSTELYGSAVNRDRTRVGLYLPDFNSALSIDTRAVCDALGLPPQPANVGYIWCIKLLNYVRQNTLIAPVLIAIGFVIERIRNVFIGPILESFPPRQKVTWTGKYW
jgi:glycosyltransferase involved in cell wall biosynthesis